MDDAPPTDKPKRSQRYRTAFVAILVLVAAGVGVLLTASVVIDLYATGRPEARREAPPPVEQAACNREVRALLDRLVREAARLEMLPLEGQTPAVVNAWDDFARGWDDAWRETGRRCRFEQLADRGLGAAFDRMAWVHLSLPRTKLKYAEMMARFSRDLAGEVAEMRRALDKSLADLDKRGAGKDRTDPDE